MQPSGYISVKPLWYSTSPWRGKRIGYVAQIALMGQSFSEGGSLLAYSLSSGGSDWREVRFLRIDSATGATEELPDKLEHVKFSSMAWSHDDKCGALPTAERHCAPNLP